VPQPAVIKGLINDFTNRSPMRTNSLIVSIFGDVVTQHGHTLWLGSLVNALAPLGVNDRLVRTSVLTMACMNTSALPGESTLWKNPNGWATGRF
jgi:phenylacetic acid degradation operon negative regulatory protein